MQRGNVLVIEDDPSLCELMSLVLSEEGFKVLTAADGLSGIELAQAAQPAIIFLDMMLPGLDGISTCQRLKQDPVLTDIPVVGITALADLASTERAFRAGAELFLSKPFGTKSLLEVVRLAVDSAEKRSPRQQLHPRFQAEVPVRCLVGVDANESGEVVGTTTNLGLGGLLLVLPQKLGHEAVVRLWLKLPEGSVPVQGAVIWRGSNPMGDGRFHHGVRLLRFAEDSDRVQYRRFLSQIAAGTAA